MKKLNLASSRFNPLDLIDKDSSRALDDCKAIAKALVVRTGEEKDPHWQEKAEAWNGGIIGVTAYFGVAERGTRSLPHVASLLSSPAAIDTAIELMQERRDIWGGALANMGGQMSFSTGVEKSGILSTTGRSIDFLNTPEVAANLGVSDFDARELNQGRMTIYLVLPPEYMRTLSPLLRVWISSLVGVVIRGGLSKSHNVHFLIDEAGSVGPMDCLVDVLNIGRGYSARLFLAYQDTGQLERCWPKGAAQGLMANTTQIFFAVNDYQTADMVVKRCGMATVAVESGGSTWGTSRQSSPGQNHSHTTYTSGGSSGWQLQKREVLTVDELTSLSPRVGLTFIPGMRVVTSFLLRSYEETKLFRRSWLRGVRAACRTFVGSAVVLSLAMLLAIAATKLFQKEVLRGGFLGGQAVQHGQRKLGQRAP